MLRVLVVDDQEEFRRLAREMLEADGGLQVVAEAADGDQAVELVHEEKPDLVLMDVQMPRMNGFQATGHILDTHPEIKVVLVSTSNEEEFARTSQEVGAVAFIPKERLTLKTLREAIQATD